MSTSQPAIGVYWWLSGHVSQDGFRNESAAERPLPAYEGDEPYFFVSYSHDDIDVVYPEIRWLQDQGFLTAADVIRILAWLIAQHGRPVCLRSDNGPEFIAEAVKRWPAEHAIGTHFIDPGSPWQNAYNESFNSIFRTTCLDRWPFESMLEPKTISRFWLDECNTIRPHGSLGGRPPVQFIEDWAAALNDKPKVMQKSLTQQVDQRSWA